MKKIIIPIGILLTTGVLHAQLSPTENYIYTKTYLDHTNLKVTETVQYLDGLSRPKQTVNIKSSPQGKDVVTKFEYDLFGRQVNEYLPLPQGGTLNGGIVPSPEGNASAVYGAEKIYSEKRLENSPLNRIQEQLQVGTDWSTKPVKFEYSAVTVADEVRKFTTVTTWQNGATKSELGENWLYTDGQLYKNTIIDEDGNKTIEFKNSKDQIIMIRKDDGSSTYYVYNEYDQLAFVLPPMASMRGDIVTNTAKHNEFCYQYSYDGKGRLVEKKLPGKGKEYMVYDKQDRLILTRDTIMEAKGQWLFTKYDKFGRVAYTGILSGAGREQMQNQIGGLNIVEEQTGTGFSKPGLMLYYTNNFFSDFQTALTVNYYDTYPRDTRKFPLPTILDQPVISYNTSVTTQGMPTASYIKNIEDDNWTKTYFYYDYRGRSVGSHSVNHLGGYTNIESQLDFAGTPKKILTIHKRKANEAGITITERFEYDHQNRLLVHKHQVDDKPEQILAENTYNELSQLKNKKVGNTLQSIDYTYNIRGWMTDINKDQMSISDLGGKLFSYKIKYNQMTGITNPDPVLFLGKDVKPRYNGNIAEVDWRAVESLGSNPPIQPKRYGYAYDTLNRLIAGYYQNPANPYTKEHTESLQYDQNGNITNLYRTSGLEGSNTTATVIDELEYIYTNGNQVSNIKDYRNNPSGYEGGGGTIEYNLNGSMWKMPDKNIGNIQYNHLNLPNRTEYGTFGLESLHTTLYGSDGMKLRKSVSKLECGFANCYSVNDISDYLDGFQYSRSETINEGGGGGPIEGFRMTSEKLKYGYEQQAYTVGNGVADSSLGIVNTTTVKTPDLRFFPTAEGFYDYIKDQYIYQYKDHLGNVRISFGRNSTGALEITDANDYYPFGMNHLRTGNALFGKGIYQNYKYNGKELQESGMYDYGARFYMPDIGRWGVVDPLAELDRRWSPYRYAYDNPIRFIDPDGRNEDIYELDTNGNLNWKEESDRDVIYASKNFDSNGKLKTDNDGGVDVGERGYITENLKSTRLGSQMRDNTGHTSDKISTLRFANNESKASEVAEYFYNNTNVETANSTYTGSNNTTFSIISTFHLESGAPIDPKRFVDNFSLNGSYFYPSTLKSQDHNHPMGLNIEPSGLEYDSNTKTFVKSTNIFVNQPGTILDTNAAKNNPSIKLRVYSSALKQYIKYNETAGTFEK